MGLLVAANACHVGDDGESDESNVTEGGEASLYRPGNRFSGWGGTDPYLDDVQPILAKRCVTCHGCTTSPCQLKLTSYEGVMRGANKHNIFENTVLSASTGPTRMKDGKTVKDWRDKGFYSVTDGGKDSVMFKLLDHGKSNADGFDTANAFGLYSGKSELLKFECLDTKKELDQRLSKTGTGMPFGLPALPANELGTLSDWLEKGAPGPTAEAQKILAAARDEGAVKEWEDFFNQTSVKAKLMSRFIYEHAFYAKMHIDDASKSRGDFFELVRSKTKTGDIQEIVTERPNDDPKGAFFYRFKKHTQIITAKDHAVFHLTDKVRARYKQLFLDTEYDPGADPGYTSLNPFEYFEKIPGKVRYQFMLESSHHLIDAMVKGDVCNGSSATYAIRDRFFTVFMKPDSDPSAIDPKLGQGSFFHLDPNSGSIFRDMDFERLFEGALKKLRPQGLSEQDLWDGNGKTDKNAVITVFRHGTNASAHQGLLGQFPETMWVLDFGNFERLYYDLVVLYRPWGPITHKLSTWRQMSHVRAHGEDLALMFLPEALRDPVRSQFTPGWIARQTEVDMAGTGYPSALANVDEKRPVQDFVSRIRKYLGPTITQASPLDPDPMTTPPAAKTQLSSRADVDGALYELTLDRGKIADGIPDVTWITVEGGSERMEYTLLANRIFTSNSRIVGDFLPGLTRLPESDSISVVHGHVGAFPQLFLSIPIGEVSGWVKANRSSKGDRQTIRGKFEIKRNTNAFWSFLDGIHKSRLAEDPLDSGIVDTSRYLWPLAVQSEPSGKVE